MKKLLTLILSLLLFISCKKEVHVEGVENISVQELSEHYLEDDGSILLDVRTKKEYDSGYIQNAMHIDVKADDFKDKIQNLDKDKTIYVYCRTGRRSLAASKILKDNGFKDVKNVKGGIKAWNKMKSEE